jgi:serine/threonine-protein kinase ATR
MINELLHLCNSKGDDERKSYSMSQHFPKLRDLGHSDLLIPLQESLTVTLPSSSSAEATHQPFPIDAPTFKGIPLPL